MRYSGHLPSVDDASVVGDAFVYDTSVDNASVDDEHYSDMSPTKYLNLLISGICYLTKCNLFAARDVEILINKSWTYM